MSERRVLIVGGGFAGLNVAKALSNRAGVSVTLIDRQNHHLFQPLLYQVAMAALSPADIAAPIRSILSRSRNVRVLQAEARSVDLKSRAVLTDAGTFGYDALVLACGATHAYFGHEEWEPHAPGLKSLPQATEIRRRVLSAFETAERIQDAGEQERWLTFAIIGGGPTGVELAGAIAEMGRHTLARDFRNVDPRRTRVLLLEAGPRILPAFQEKQAQRATRDLQGMGVQVRVDARVTKVSADGVDIGAEHVRAATVLWAAGVRAAPIARSLGVELDNAGRVLVEADLSVPGYPQVFVAGDLARALDIETGKPLPGVATVAQQQGKYVGKLLRDDPSVRQPFRYKNEGQLATIGRSHAIAELKHFNFAGRPAWWLWLLVHIYGLTGFRNRLTVLVQWAWSYFTFGRGARLIVPPEWREYPAPETPSERTTR
ncbi:MAG TPA: NAD(P)/FAD-dependent oxidoreductase [Steroidobacteraceae bacterium]|nr:NAD(P)/FAD-dependent oxidoreductase [Steroidobacteraceae bacterium]